MLLDWVAQEAVGWLSPMPDVIYYLLHKQCTHSEILRSPTAMQVQATGIEKSLDNSPFFSLQVSPTLHCALVGEFQWTSTPCWEHHMLCKTTCYNAHVITYN